MSWFYAVFVLGLAGCCFADLSTEYDHFAALDPAQKMKLYWTINRPQESISFAVEAATTGWIGLGFSSNTGRMKGSDIVIGWVQDGTPHLTDRYGEGHFLPALDDSQDYKLISGAEKDGKTTLRFSRKINTCDKNDLKIEEGTVRLIFAYNNEDPTSNIAMNKHSYKGSRSLLLLDFGKTSRPDPSWRKLDLLMNNVTIPEVHTTYLCTIFKLPDLGEKQHIVRFEPIVQPGNEGFVHHFVVNQCKRTFPDHLLNFTGSCLDYANMPAEVLDCVTGSLMGAWGVGGGPFVYPDHVGYPMGVNDSGNIVIFEVHYDNPELIKGRLDSSGVRFYYTPKLRQYDAGILGVGVGILPWMVIPPNQESWVSTGYCRSECTRKGLENSKLPEKGIKIFSSFLHTHSAGRATWTEHIRDGVQLPDIARDNNYDFNFQEMHLHRKEIHIKPGDDIIHHCQYSTKDRNKTIFGGFSTSNEMCINFVSYYPRSKWLPRDCYSNNVPASYKFLEKYFPSYKSYSQMWFNPLQAAKPNWTDEMAKDFRNIIDKEDLILDCSNKGNITIFRDWTDPKNRRNKIVIKKPYFAPSSCEVNSSPKALTVNIIFIWLSIWTIGAWIFSL